MLIYGPENIRVNGGVSSKDTILTYNLAAWQLNLLGEGIKEKRIKGRPLKIFIANAFTDIYAIPHFIAFLNFAAVNSEDIWDFFEYWRECSQPLGRELKTEIIKEYSNSDFKMPPTYVFNCHFPGAGKMPYLFTDGDVFSSPEKLRLTLLQEMKNREGRGLACENSIRLRRVLKIYQRLAYRGETTIKEVRHLEESVSPRMLQQDMALIRQVDPGVGYDPKRKKYVLCPDSDEKRGGSMGAGGPVSRLRRILLIYRQLLYTGRVTKEEADKMGRPVSLRMFQRDLRIIREEIDPNVKYDKDGKRFVLVRP